MRKIIAATLLAAIPATAQSDTYTYMCKVGHALSQLLSTKTKARSLGAETRTPIFNRVRLVDTLSSPPVTALPQRYAQRLKAMPI